MPVLLKIQLIALGSIAKTWGSFTFLSPSSPLTSLPLLFFFFSLSPFPFILNKTTMATVNLSSIIVKPYQADEKGRRCAGPGAIKYEVQDLQGGPASDCHGKLPENGITSAL